MIESLRNVAEVALRLLPPSGLSDQPRYTPRDLANSVPRIPILEPSESLEFEEMKSDDREM